MVVSELNTMLRNEVSPDKCQRVMTWLPHKTVRMIDAKRGYYSKSQLIEIAIDRFLEEMDKNNDDDD